MIYTLPYYRCQDYKTHQEAYKKFSKSIESIKRKQVAQEFSNGKDDGKKKKFDFQGEMKKFADEQNTGLSGMKEIIESEMKEKIQKEMIAQQKELISAPIEKLSQKVKDATRDLETGVGQVIQEVDNTNKTPTNETK